MATVKGKWLFNDEVTQIAPDPGKGNTTVVQEVNFTFIKWDGSIGQANGIGVHRDSYKFSLVYLDGTTILSWAYIYRVYSGSWSTGWDNENGKTITFIEEQEVSDEFYEWFTANATQVIESTPTTITYNGTDASVEVGQTATLACNGKKALTDIVIVFGADGSITYNGTETAVSTGQTATLACAGKKMLTDVVITVSGGYALSGVWKFNETLDFSGVDTNTIFDVPFSCEGYGLTFDGFGFDKAGGTYMLVYKHSDKNENRSPYSYGSWISESRRYVDFGTTPQEVSPEFYEWFTANATKQ